MPGKGLPARYVFTKRARALRAKRVGWPPKRNAFPLTHQALAWRKLRILLRPIVFGEGAALAVAVGTLDRL